MTKHVTEDHLNEIRNALDAADEIDGSGSNPAPPVPTGADVPEASAALYPLNDLGNGQRFDLYFGEDVLNVPRVGWFVWDEQRWGLDDDAVAVRSLAHKIPEKIMGEIDHLDYADWEATLLSSEDELRDRQRVLAKIIPTERSEQQAKDLIDLNRQLDTIENIHARMKGRRKAHRDYSRSTGNSGKITNMLIEAAVLQSFELDALDADPLMINTASETLKVSVEGGGDSGMSRVASIATHDHDRGDYLTKVMPVDYDPTATCAGFDKFIERVLPDPDVRGYVQRFLGVAMTSLKVQKILFFYGAGANGKSVLVDLIARIMGDYSATAKIESLTGSKKRGGADATPDLVPLIGARFVRSSEPEEGERMREAEIKALTGGEPMMIRGLNKDFVEVELCFKLVVSGNHKPEIRGTDDGIWRRVSLVPFDVQIPEAERDPLLGEKLWQERSGILNWMLAGLTDYLEGGLQEPASVTDATKEYRETQDPLGTFLTDACEVTGSEDDFMLSRDLIEAFNTWLEMQGQARWGGRTVSNRLATKEKQWCHPVSKKKFASGKRSATGKRGIRLTADFARDMSDFRSGQHGDAPAPDREVIDPQAF
jgi:putative DNA primase/helicase